MMLTRNIILLSSINGWLLHHHGFIVAFVSANIIYLIITNIDVVVIAAARQVVAGSLLRGLRDNG